MNRILSWKIKSGVYAYIYLPNSKTHISSRIPEDSPLWTDIIGEISGWGKDKYENNFNSMADEVSRKYNFSIEWKPEYWEYTDENAVNGVNIVLLSGEDGVGSNGGYEGGYEGDGSDIYEKFEEEIEKRLEEVRNDIEKQNSSVKENIESNVAATIADTKKTIDETKKKLNEVREELEEKWAGATDALNKAAALFDLGEDISSEDIKNILSSVTDYNVWFREHGEDIVDLKTDYNSASKQMGSIGELEDVTSGLFGKFATSLSVLSGTVGSVAITAEAAYGYIGETANFIESFTSAVTDIQRYISASAGVISDTIEHINGSSYTAYLESIMDAKNAEMRDSIMTETNSGITNVTRILNGISGIVSDVIYNENSDGSLANIGNKMDIMEFTIDQWMTKTDSAMSAAIDIREQWSAESGKLSTVASMVAETDSYGNVLYFVSGTTNDGSTYEKLVTQTDIIRDGYKIFVDEVGNEYKDTVVYTHLSSKLSSYIQQTTSSVTLSVLNDDGLTAAIKLAIEDDKSIISMVANEIVIDADMIVEAISAKTANIGGIVLDYGHIYSMAGEGSDETFVPNFLLDGSKGKLIAKDAEITGKIIANEGSFSGNVYATNGIFSGNVYATGGVFNGHVIATSLKLGNQGIEDYINGKLPSDDDYLVLGEEYGNITIKKDGSIIAENAVISGTVYANSGYFAGEIQSKTGKIGGLSVNKDYLSYSGTIINSGNDKFVDDNGNLFSLMCGVKEDYYFYKFKHIEKNNHIYMFTDDYKDKKTNVTLFYKNGGKYYTYEGINFGVLYPPNNSNISDWNITVNGIPSINNNEIITGKYKMDSATALKVNYNEFFTFPFNFAVNENGEMFCKTLKSTNANITGYISAQGEFSGKLNNVYGNIRVCDIKDCDIENININKLAFPYATASVIRFDNNAEISTTGNSSSEIIINEIDEIIQNNTKSIKNVTESLKIFSFYADKNYAVEIPSFEITIERYAPGDTIHQASTGNQFTIKSGVETLANPEITLTSYSYGGTQKVTYEIGETSGNVNAKGHVSVMFHVSIPIGYSNYGVPYLRIKIKPKSKNYVKLTEKNDTLSTIPFNMLIGYNGVKIEYAYGRKIIINDSGIYLNNKKLNISVMEELGILT